MAIGQSKDGKFNVLSISMICAFVQSFGCACCGVRGYCKLCRTCGAVRCRTNCVLIRVAIRVGGRFLFLASVASSGCIQQPEGDPEGEAVAVAAAGSCKDDTSRGVYRKVWTSRHIPDVQAHHYRQRRARARSVLTSSRSGTRRRRTTTSGCSPLRARKAAPRGDERTRSRTRANATRHRSKRQIRRLRNPTPPPRSGKQHGTHRMRTFTQIGPMTMKKRSTMSTMRPLLRQRRWRLLPLPEISYQRTRKDMYRHQHPRNQRPPHTRMRQHRWQGTSAWAGKIWGHHMRQFRKNTAWDTVQHPHPQRHRRDEFPSKVAVAVCCSSASARFKLHILVARPAAQHVKHPSFLVLSRVSFFLRGMTCSTLQGGCGCPLEGR